MSDLEMINFHELDNVSEHDTFYCWNGKPFTGRAVLTFPDGSLELVMDVVEGEQSGKWMEWYAPGQLYYEKELQANAFHGRAREWHRNGQLAVDGEYELGCALWEKEWDENGVQTRDYVIAETNRNYLDARRRMYGPKSDAAS
ncbi:MULTISPECIES: toxin-antitoxin system YwqK family antitoxin [unclassified Streptomyces]|uniref:toxin-antitoxin system YwqK family antitoxin n=1 Tax=unclassified Streptomyces TaxID=2593676 RepID=UPI0035DFE691